MDMYFNGKSKKALNLRGISLSVNRKVQSRKSQTATDRALFLGFFPFASSSSTGTAERHRQKK
ncbi:MAG: hypothetical protein D3908_07710 [Candidatus Electrothrix sp. AUS4]|nr:hypothetical protein [Candidatus Electrothrix sp. AUS4]